MKSLLFLVTLLAVSGCGSITKLPQNQVVAHKTNHVIALGDVETKNISSSLEQFIRQLNEPVDNISIVSGRNVSSAQMNAIKATLGRMGHKRVHIQRVDAESQLDVSFVSLSLRQQQAKPLLFEDYWFSASAVNSQFGASTEANVAAQAHRPQDLVNPSVLDAPNPIATSGAVERYQKGSVRALKGMSIEAGSSK